MHLSMQTPVIEGSRFTPSVSPGLPGLLITPNQENKKASCDFLEELKCLFLRVRNPPKSSLEELIRQVLKCELNSAEGIEWLHTANRHFGDFRNKLVNGIENLVENFKEKRSWLVLNIFVPFVVFLGRLFFNDIINIINYRSVSPLQKGEIIAFVNESATAYVLSRWLNATNIDELEARGSMSHLCKFVQHAFAINYASRDTEKTKSLDRLTKDIQVPS